MNKSLANFMFTQIGQSKNGLSDLLFTPHKSSHLPEENFDWVFPQTLIYGTIILLQMSRLPERSSL